MTRMTVIVIAVSLVACCDFSRGDERPAPAAKTPNILIILADDLGYGDVQCYNPQRGKIPTPNIDKLASQGMRFTDGHSSSGVCSPSRYALLTGRYHWRTRQQSGIVGIFGEPLIAPDRMTLGTLAKQHGYRTAAIGKWHLGWDWPIPENKRKLFTEVGGKRGGREKSERALTDAHRAAWREVFSQTIPGGPTTRGFDEYFGVDVPNWPPFCFIENNRTLGIPSELLSAEKVGSNQASRQGPALPGWTLEPILPALGDRACDFITRQAKAKKPFLLYLPLTTPHTPLAVNQAWRGKSGLDSAAADLIMETDDVVGRVLNTLEASGVAGETLVLFTSDNGFAPYVGAADLEKRGHYPSGPLRGYKFDVWEGGHRIPFIVRWPGVVKPGGACGQLVHQADILRTLADILGAKLPDNAGEDSFSLLPLLRGEDKPVREHAVSCAGKGVPGVRKGDWKFIPGEKPMLYNLAEDIGEKKNLANDKPERVAEMKALLEQLISDGRSTLGAKQKNDVDVRRYSDNASPSKLLPSLQTEAASRPNIILVMPDDVGYGDYAFLGSPLMRTPTVDALKKQSLLFTRFHVSPTCSPTRSALMSGRHEFRNGVTHTILERERLSLKTFTLPQMLKSAGYTTGIFGKWHLGDEEAYRPESRGFDEVYIHGGGGIGQTYPGSCGDAPGNSNIDPALWHNGKWEKTKGYCTDLFFSQATKWMEAKRSADKPFFAYIPLNAAHGPHVLPEAYYQHYLGKPDVSEDTAKFFGMIENIDTNVGRLLQQLDAWKIADNTLVIYLGTDNGGTAGVKIFNAGLRGGKGTVYQGGTRSPCFFRWPAARGA